MDTQSIRDQITDRARRLGQWFRSLFTNKYFWQGLGALFVLVAAAYLLVNELIMPQYTRHDASVTVPQVVDRPFEEASQLLERRDLQVERQRARQFNPNVPRGEVIDQQPPADALVKPGRRVYLTINEGQTPMVEVPDLTGTSIREAQNQLLALGLQEGAIEEDTIPAPYENTITKQSPAPGDSLQEGSSVDLWYSTGLGTEFASVPDVTDMTVPEARQTLLERKLRSVVVDAEEDMDLNRERVHMQSREPGEEVREGTEIRLFVQGDATADDEIEVRRQQ